YCMRKGLLVLLGVVPLMVFSQEDFTLKGKIKRLPEGAKVFIQYRDQGQTILDSAVVKKNKFTYHGSVSEPAPARLILASNGETMEALQKEKEETATNSITAARDEIKYEAAEFTDA